VWTSLKNPILSKKGRVFRTFPIGLALQIVIYLALDFNRPDTLFIPWSLLAISSAYLELFAVFLEST
jgi:hypothetical protein